MSLARPHEEARTVAAAAVVGAPVNLGLAMELPAGDASLRQSALLLHAMQPQDRHWILTQLPESQRTGVQALLAELQQLGMPADPGLLQRVLGEAAPPAPAARPPGLPQHPMGLLHHAAEPSQHAAEPLPEDSPVADADFFLKLGKEEIAVLAQVLRAEPSSLAVRLLRLRAWPWRETLLAGVGQVQSQQIQEGLAGPPPTSAPLLEQALLRVLRKRLEEAARGREPPGRRPEPAPARPLRGWQRLRSRLAALGTPRGGPR